MSQTFIENTGSAQSGDFDGMSHIFESGETGSFLSEDDLSHEVLKERTLIEIENTGQNHDGSSAHTLNYYVYNRDDGGPGSGGPTHYGTLTVGKSWTWPLEDNQAVSFQSDTVGGSVLVKQLKE